MKSLVRQTLVFFLLLVVLEKAGVPLIPMVIPGLVNREVSNSDAESASKESENIKEFSPKEYLLCESDTDFSDILLSFRRSQPFSRDQRWSILFFPPVPSPPPDLG